MPRNKALQSGEQQSAQAPLGFPQFRNLPPEIQGQIFTEAIDKPNVHIIGVKREIAVGIWRFKFGPVPKNSDPSGYRRLQDLSTVNRRAYATMRLATEKHNVRLPFRGLNSRIDGMEDLGIFNIPQSRTHISGYFHPDHQILNPGATNFDYNGLAEKVAGIQKVAIKHCDHHEICNQIWCIFRCAHPDGAHTRHINHRWRMCPDELFGLLNCFPSLREFYIILEPARTNDQHRAVEAYTKNFYSLPASSPLRRGLATFHSRDHTYLELHPALMRHHEDWSSSATPSEAAAGTVRTLRFKEYRNIVTLLDELRDRCFLGDVDEKVHPDTRRYVAQMCRLSVEERKKLVFKVLLPVPDGMNEGWEGEKGEAFRTMMKDVKL